jgi:hypothetical protein
MKNSIQIGVGLLLAAALGAVYLLQHVGPRSRLLGFDSSMQRQYEHLAVGQPRGEVFATLGQPRLTNTTLCLPQRRGFEKEFAKTNGLSTAMFYLWGNGGNWFYCIGFDADDRLQVKTEGHS